LTARRDDRCDRARRSTAYLLCDLDGVLVDSGDAVERAWRWWAGEHALAWTDVEPGIHGMPSREHVARLLPGADAFAESRRIELYQASDLEGVVAVRGARELVAAWPPDRIAVVTSASVPLAEARLGAAGIAPPRVVVTEERVRAGKPDPEGYLLAARELGARPAECVVLEDAPAGVAAARAAGMRVIGVLTTHTRDELAAADAFARDLIEAHGLLGV
jgi:mannitol-1-/sugar-/sorbitol-6-phosphatase